MIIRAFMASRTKYGFMNIYSYLKSFVKTSIITKSPFI